MESILSTAIEIESEFLKEQVYHEKFNLIHAIAYVEQLGCTQPEPTSRRFLQTSRPISSYNGLILLFGHFNKMS
jgi:hypothetical protein